MSRTFVALDLETTGLDPVADRVTEIGAVRFDEDGHELETFEMLVNPGREIPFFIERMTGVTNDAVRLSPRLLEVADDLRRFVGGAPVIGQNIAFDLGCLRREGVELGVSGIDTAHLSRILMPERQGRGLIDLATSLDVEAGAHHRALPDARTAAAIFTALRRRLNEIPASQRLALARLVSLHDLPLADLIGGGDWEDLPASERQLPAVRTAPAWPQLERKQPAVPVPAGKVSAVFDAAAGIVERYEEREEQREMAEAVRQGLAFGGHWLIEAGTGVGKSLAYLIPAALHAIANGERIVVSTNTINLQEQLLTKDIPALRRALVEAGVIKDGSEFRASLLKGRANYLCLRRWVAGFGAAAMDPDFARLGAAMHLWLPRTETGDRSELSLDHTEWFTWQRFSAQDTDCLQRQSQYVRDGTCFLHRARKAAESAHILVVNHALLLADLAAGGSAIPPYDHLIVDEAHNLEDQATQQFGGIVSRRLIADALDGLHRRAARDQREGGVVTLLKALPEGGSNMAGRALEEAAGRAQESLAPLFEMTARLAPRGGDDDRLLLDRAVRNREEWEVVQAEWARLDSLLGRVSAAAGGAAKIVRESAPTEDPDALAGEIETAVRKVDDLRALLASLVAGGDEQMVSWIGRERDGTASFNCAPLEVGPRLWEELFAKRKTVVATSATLSAGGSMAFAARRLGLERPETLQLGSPFDYKQATLLCALTDVPEPSDPGYDSACAAAIAELARASRGRALVLFTSHNAMRRVAEQARSSLEADGLALLVQGIDGPPRQLTENLIAEPGTVVFGTSSFWEGVDVRGKALSLLVIARLPFAVPSDPIYKARSEQYDNPFEQYALPGAILKFRQGFGRLIRDKEDRGVVAVLDRRIYERRYGETFVQSLPPCTKFKGDMAAVAGRVRDWLV